MKIHSTILGILMSILLWQFINLLVTNVSLIQYIIIEILVVFSIEIHTLAVQKIIKNHVNKSVNHNVDEENTHL